ncbi:MAG: hypothetical protein ACO1QB_14425 [Verrucomicrobiales bacterium]
MGKAEISWKSRTEDGQKREVYAKHIGSNWVFHVREKRFDEWEPMPSPTLEDWMELLDGVQRRIARRLLRPEEEARVRKIIRETFPDAPL